MIDTPIARNSDPITSHLADEYLTKSGKRVAQVYECELAVRKHPDLTARELSAVTGIAHEVMHKRLPDSNNLEKGESVKCSISGRKAHVWRVKQ